MARQIINVGTTANDGTGDGLRTAYIKCNDNFLELYANTSAPTFLSNGTSNIGVASSDGNITVSVANTSNVAIFTQTSLNLDGNLIANGNISGGNLSISSSVTSDLIPTGTGVLDLGNSTNRWGNLFLTGSTLTLGDIVFKDNGSNTLGIFGADGTTPGLIDITSLSTSTISASGNIVAANIESNNNITTSGFFIGDGGFLSNVTAASNVAVSQIANGTTILAIASTAGNIVGTVAGSGVININTAGVDITGNLTTTDAITATSFQGDIKGSVFSDDSVTIVDAVHGIVTADVYAGVVEATGNITAQNFIGNGSQLTDLPVDYTDADATALLASFGSNTIITTGNITAGNISGAGSTITSLNASNLSSGTVPSGRLSGTYTITVSGSATTAGTVTSAAQPNITSVGSLTGLTVSGNIEMSNNNINGLAEPAAGSDAATKSYVDTTASASLHYHDPVRLEEPTALTATYNNGTSGVGATLTNAGANAALVIDGVTTNTSDRILIYRQANAAHNGVYTVTTVGDGATQWVMTRATDADSYGASDPDALGQGDAFFVQEGDTGAGELYVMNTEGTITFGTTNITFAQVSSAAIYSATNGVDLTGTTFSLDSTYSPTFAGLTVPSITHSGTDGVGNIGASGQGFNTVFAKATSAEYADVAEMYASSSAIEPGTVVVFGGSAEVISSARDADAMVAGVVSTNPAYLMNNSLSAVHSVAVALLGRVPTKVAGPVKRGQMLVSTFNGHARAEENPKIGTVIGKALEDFDGEQGVIEVVIGRL